MVRKHWALGAGGLLLWVIWLWWLWQPERQLRLHQEHLLKAVAGRNWKAVSGLLADDYSDAWDGSKTETPVRAAEALRSFFTLSVQGSPAEPSPAGVIAQRLRLAGSGSPIADLVIDKVNSLTEPFVFTWVHRSGKPWDWQLVKVEQPELHIDATGF